MTRIGIVTGTRIEAACFAAAACSGADAERARDAARRLLAAGCAALASVGAAGGLHPALAPGSVVIATSVVDPGGAVRETHAPWREALAATLESGGLAARLAAVAGSDAAVLRVDEKRRLFDVTGALCVDMESHAVAAVAAEAGVPFLALRVVADPAHRDLPRAAMVSVGTQGELRAAALLVALAVRPVEIVQMARLARDSRRALGSLRRVAALGGPTLSLLLPLA